MLDVSWTAIEIMIRKINYKDLIFSVAQLRARRKTKLSARLKFYKVLAEVIRSHENEHVRSIEQGEARHRKYKWLKLDDGQA
jgi:hypothetical protein